MTTPIRILTLGTFVLLKRPLHGYEIQRELKEWGAAGWASISYSSIYFTLDRLAEEGLLAEASVDQENNRPARTKYDITEAGRQAFQSWLADYWLDVKPGFDPFQIALTFLPAMPHGTLVETAQARVEALRRQIDAVDWGTVKSQTPDIPPHIEENFRLAKAHLEAELSCVESILARVTSGDLP